MEFFRVHFPEPAELILVDDGSRPDQALQPEDLTQGVTLIRHRRNLGKGGAVRSGIMRAQGSYIVFTDSDLPFSLEPLSSTLQVLRDAADIVIGERQFPQGRAAPETSWIRRLSSAVYTWMVHHLLGLDFPDIQCGYKGYHGAVAKELFGRLEVTSFAFEAEIMLRAQKAGYRIHRAPLWLAHNEDSSVRLMRDAPRMFIDTLRIAWRARRGAYG